MPIAIIAVLVIAALGAGFFFFTNSALETTPDPTTEVAVRPTDETENTAPEATAEDETNEQDATDTSDDPAVTTDATITTDTETKTNTTYTNGTYSASASYLTPRRTEHEVGVTLTIVDDVVVDSAVTFNGVEGEYANDNQARFDLAYSAEVIGQPLDDISLSRVGSASLTSSAFNEAKAKIIAEARS